jgi:hypothetical protein
MIDWRWFREPAIAHLFVYLLLQVCDTDTEWCDRVIKRGQMVTTRNRICQETGLTEKVVRGALTKLQKTGEINVETTNKFSIITVCNYDKYQNQYEIENPKIHSIQNLYKK